MPDPYRPVHLVSAAELSTNIAADHPPCSPSTRRRAVHRVSTPWAAGRPGGTVRGEERRDIRAVDPRRRGGCEASGGGETPRGVPPDPVPGPALREGPGVAVEPASRSPSTTSWASVGSLLPRPLWALGSR